MVRGEPKKGNYSPSVSARRPGGRPDAAPKWRVLIHHKQLALYGQLVERVGLQNAQRMWDYLASSPDQKPSLGSVTPMKGRNFQATTDGKSRVYHYDVSGAGRVNFRYHPCWRIAGGDPHPVVWIIGLDLSSH